jgi:dihydrodipicolinate synthase/N-acetylneuraminate lyase
VTHSHTTAPATDLPDGFVEYFAARQRQRAERIQRVYGRMTKREQQLFREAAVMGYVRGAMGTGVPSNQRPPIPPDSEIVAEVIDACLAFEDLYRTVARIDRAASRAARLAETDESTPTATDPHPDDDPDGEQ